MRKQKKLKCFLQWKEDR